MANLPRDPRIPLEGAAHESAIVQCGRARMTVLTARTIRLEYAPEGQFEDRPSRAFIRRALPVPPFRVDRTGDAAEITTDALELVYRDTNRGFTRETLSIKVKETGRVWHFGDSDPFNLGGTIRTLDGCEGAVPLPDGLLSRTGWAVVDDSRSEVFSEEAWLTPRTTTETDLYFFGHGTDYVGCMNDLRALGGSVPVIPRWVLGNWWSRHWIYSRSDLHELVQAFEDRHIPLSVCVLDTDWHIVENPHTRGWTGYTWNRELLGEPEELLSWFHERGIRVCLSLHPADGVHPHEEAYREMAEATGIDPSSKKPVPFDILDTRFAEAYLRILHHPLEKAGVDFWWMDWQQGTVKGFDPEFLLNHAHYVDLSRGGTRRGPAFSRWAGLGSHRYPVSFSGDTLITWDSLHFQPYLTATAANVGCCWWSHDIGGHFMGIEDPECFLRWLQFGILSPVNRIHSSKFRFIDRRPWTMDPGTFHRSREALVFRTRLVPYLYTMARRTHRTSRPLCEPMYWEDPRRHEAYCCPSQYRLGTQLIAAPYTRPLDPETGLSRQVVWLPEGSWRNFFTGEYHEGDAWYARYGTLDDIPLFAKAGAILPLDGDPCRSSCSPPADIELHVIAGNDGSFTLHEDDPEAVEPFDDSTSVRTPMSCRWRDDRLELHVGPALGNRALIPATRHWNVVVTGVRQPDGVTCTAGEEDRNPTLSYDHDTERLTADVGSIDTAAGFTLRLATTGRSLLSCRDRMPATIEKMIKLFRLVAPVKEILGPRIEELCREPERLRGIGSFLSPPQFRAVCETLFDAGCALMDAPGESTGTWLVLWNNRERDDVSFIRLSEMHWRGGCPEKVVPRFAAIGFSDDKHPYRDDTREFFGTEPPFPAVLRWWVGVQYAGAGSVTEKS